MVPRPSHMHAMTTWTKQKEHERTGEGRKNAEPCSGEHHHGKASCEILNTSHAGSVIMPNKRSLPRMSSVQGLAPAFHLARHPVHDDVAGILTVMTSNRKTSSFHAVRCCRPKLYLSFLSISLLVFFALICTGMAPALNA